MMLRILPALLLVLSHLVNAQQIETDIQARMESYLKSFPQEKLYLHLARQQVLAGEELYFRIYHLSTKDNQPFPFSKVAYVDLIGADKEVIDKVKVIIDAEGGEGYIRIPATINSGWYQIRAYTQWMRNFDDALYFTSEFQVVNTFKRLGLSTPDSASHKVTVLPEGGAVLAGLKCQMGIHVTDFSGAGLSYEGTLIDQQGEEYSTFKSGINGIASFEYQPGVGQVWQLRITDAAGNQSVHALPAGEARGMNIHVTPDQNEFRVEIRSKGLDSQKPVYLSVISHGNFVKMQAVSLNDGIGNTVIKAGELMAGVNQLTLHDQQGVPAAERLVFMKPEDAVSIALTSDKKQYENRENVTLKGSIDTKLAGDLSVSVYSWSPLQEMNQTDIHSWVWLESELPGIIPNASYYLSEQAKAKEIDDLMLVYGWRRYESALMDGSSQYEYLPEFREPLISGTVRDVNGNPVSETIIYFAGPDSLSTAFVARSGKQGRFILETPRDLQSREIYARTADSTYTIELDQYFAPAPEVDPRHFSLSTGLEDWLVRQSESMQVNNLFNPMISEADNKALSFYGKPTAVYYLDDYTRFPVMEEVMREYVYGVFVRRNEGRFIFRVLDDRRNIAMEEQPLMLIDGVPVFDVDKVMAMNPLSISRIEVVKSRYGYGPLRASGIVAFYSYKQDMGGYVLQDGILKESYLSAQRRKKFYVPDHQSSENRYPDFRNQLYWNPKLETDEQGQFSMQFPTSDAKGNYRVVIQGRTRSGAFGSSSTTFSVR